MTLPGVLNAGVGCLLALCGVHVEGERGSSFPLFGSNYVSCVAEERVTWNIFFTNFFFLHAARRPAGVYYSVLPPAASTLSDD